MADEDEVSEAEFNTWLPAGRAEEQMRPIGATACQAINEGVTSGRVRVMAELAQFGLGDEKTFFLIWPTEWLSPSWGPFWTTSNITLQISRDGTRERPVELFGVRFDPEGIKRIRRAAGINETPVSLPVRNVGRPPAAFWDALWVEMCRQIYAGDLDHKIQVNIETAMSKWLLSKGHDASEGTIRTRASKLFAALNAEDKNRL